ncbi:MAG: tRNA (guanosine(37)-N1)-methyltransferase TrmD [Patescibacteria group bacterium]|nr:tRNA (guanosine(37)-N1)-methyltransferase TrmD [Patescibacteria group bacterium]
MLTINIITLFPKMFSGPFSESIIRRAQKEGKVKINIHDLRNWAIDERGTVDSRPYGGGKGMVLRPEPIFQATESIKPKRQPEKTTVILLTPQGKIFNQQKAQKLKEQKNLILICGHYEGVDERVRTHLVDDELSIGNYILTGGEIPAMVVTDAVVRLLPGVLEKEATSQESFQNSSDKRNAFIQSKGTGILEYPQYTRPRNFRGLKVPEILLSGNHQEIKKWRRRKAVSHTKERRPELLKKSA